jgi:hypothetical protein
MRRSPSPQAADFGLGRSVPRGRANDHTWDSGAERWECLADGADRLVDRGQRIRERCVQRTRRRLTSPAWSVPTLRVLLCGKAPLSGADYRCTACCPPLSISGAVGPLSTDRTAIPTFRAHQRPKRVGLTPQPLLRLCTFTNTVLNGKLQERNSEGLHPSSVRPRPPRSAVADKRVMSDPFRGASPWGGMGGIRKRPAQR